MKGTLTKEHIANVEKEAQDPLYKMAGVISFAISTENPFAILKITPKGLIFIKGTDDTGFAHIYQRHSGYSSKVDWDNFYNNKGEIITKEDSLGRKKWRLDNPSSFSPHSIPIHDYLSISDQIYKPENLNNEKNKKKDLFDLYDGIASGLDGNEFKYRLLTYKNSKIVHTLIPLTKLFNKQKERIINFARQSPKSRRTLTTNDFQIEIPYVDEYQIIRYIVIVRNAPRDETKEKWYIQVNSPFGDNLLTYYFGSREKDFDIYSENYLRRLENVDFSPIEEEIKKIEKQLRPL